VARRVRRLWRDALFLAALSGYWRDEDKRLAAEAGFDRHLTKPVDRSAAVALLAQVAASRHASEAR
jgi:CheY-like chemotaxis protein